MGFLMAALGLIPGVLDLLKSWQAKKLDTQVELTKAKLGVERDKAVEHVRLQQTTVTAVAGSKLLTILVLVFAAPLAVYFNKVIVWDIVLDLGSTPSLKDAQVVSWANTIIAFVFGAPTVLALGRMLKG